jgi:hypothetical protein
MRVISTAVLDIAGLPVVDTRAVLGRAHRVDGIALDLAGGRYAAALAASLHIEVFFERVVLGWSEYHAFS